VLQRERGNGLEKKSGYSDKSKRGSSMPEQGGAQDGEWKEISKGL